jgi:hypothetical protein
MRNADDGLWREGQRENAEQARFAPSKNEPEILNLRCTVNVGARNFPASKLDS